MLQALWLSARKAECPWLSQEHEWTKKTLRSKWKIIGLGTKNLGGSWKWRLNPHKMGTKESWVFKVGPFRDKWSTMISENFTHVMCPGFLKSVPWCHVLEQIQRWCGCQTPISGWKVFITQFWSLECASKRMVSSSVHPISLLHFISRSSVYM